MLALATGKRWVKTQSAIHIPKNEQVLSGLRKTIE